MERIAAIVAMGLAAIALTGCAPRRPSSLDYVPNYGPQDITCKEAEIFLDAAVEQFNAGEKLEHYSECYRFGVAVTKFDVAGGPCPYAAIQGKYPGFDRKAFGEWINPCVKILQDANTYASELQDYAAKESSPNALSWRDSLVILGTAALLSAH